MPYVPLNPARPDGSVQTGPQVTPSIRDNQRALADAAIMGALKGWNLAVGGTDLTKPATLTYTNGTQKLRATITWDASDNPTRIVWDRDYGAGYQRLGIKTITWSGGNVSSVTWS
jgi:hypothetical protein